MIRFLMTDAGHRTCTCGVHEISDTAADTGEAGNWPFFPISSLNIGDNGSPPEFVDYFLVPLICKQGDYIFCTFILY